MNDTSPNNHWPDFVGIGAIKSGTTWLYRCLREHPEVLMPRLKELQFFDLHFERGNDWYHSFFRSAAASQVTGEISPQYMSDSNAPNRMADVLPQSTKFVVALRNPVDRAYSHYHMDFREAVGMSAEDKVSYFSRLVASGNSKYVQFGFYADQILPFLDKFPRSNFHFVLFEDIRSKPQEVVQKLYTFLSIDPRFEPPELYQRINMSKRYRSVTLFRMLRAAVRRAEMAGFGRPVEWLKFIGVRDAILKTLETPDDYLPMSTSTRSYLVELYKESNSRLSAVVGRDLTAWNQPR